jgi:excisionase family DNA binding protein
MPKKSLAVVPAVSSPISEVQGSLRPIHVTDDRELDTALATASVVPTSCSFVPTLIVPRLLRIQDAARYLGATNWFVEELIRNNQIRSLVLGKRRVLDIHDLNAWIESEKGRAA